MDKLKRHKQIRVFEGFAGYGGATYGLERAGINFKVVDILNLINSLLHCMTQTIKIKKVTQLRIGEILQK